ncbi:MAG: (d)CMP kinase [Candidatus Bathyarchaeia archaeon]
MDRSASGSSKRIVITVSGLHGTGKSTAARRLSEALGLRYFSAGELMRSMAAERGISLEEFSSLAERDPELDRLVDDRTKEEAERGNVVIDAALSGWMADDADIKIFLTAPADVRIERIAHRDGVTVDEAREETLLRERSERNRYKRYYGVDVLDLSIYDLVLNTGLFDADGTARILKKVVDEYCSGGEPDVGR